jgi:hypothetical protein
MFAGKGTGCQLSKVLECDLPTRNEENMSLTLTYVFFTTLEIELSLAEV